MTENFSSNEHTEMMSKKKESDGRLLIQKVLDNVDSNKKCGSID